MKGQWRRRHCRLTHVEHAKCTYDLEGELNVGIVGGRRLQASNLSCLNDQPWRSLGRADRAKPLAFKETYKRSKQCVVALQRSSHHTRREKHGLGIELNLRKFWSLNLTDKQNLATTGALQSPQCFSRLPQRDPFMGIGGNPASRRALQSDDKDRFAGRARAEE